MIPRHRRQLMPLSLFELLTKMTTRPPSASIHCYRLVVVAQIVVVVVVVVVVVANINMLFSLLSAFVVVSIITW